MAEPRPKTGTTKSKVAPKVAEIVYEEPVAPASSRRTTTSRSRAKKAIGEHKSEPGSQTSISPQERYRMVAEAAYFRAERRGFTGGDPIKDWLEAEAEVSAFLEQRK